MRAAQIIQTFAAVALLAIPATAMAAPDQNSGNQNQNRCGYTNNNGQWIGTPCNNGQNGQWNNGQNGQWNNNGRHRNRDRDQNDNRGNRDNGDREDNGNRNGRWNNNGQYNNGGNSNGGYNNGQWNNGRGNRNAPIAGSVSSFSPYNLYLSNGTHVLLHNGTVINPTGANLAAGTRVRVVGTWNADGTYNANEIDVTNRRY